MIIEKERNYMEDIRQPWDRSPSIANTFIAIKKSFCNLYIL